MGSSSLVAAFAAGLLGSVHCVGMCGAFAASCTRAPGGLPAWHLGRVATYALLGAIAGAIGRFLPGPVWIPAVLATLLLIWFALGLAGLVPEPQLLPPGLALAGNRAAAKPTTTAQLVFGAANGLLPCGLVYSALGMAVAVASPGRGALTMLAFGAGTLPALSIAALGLRQFALATLMRRRLFAALVLATGLWAIWARANGQPLGGHYHQSLPESPSR